MPELDQFLELNEPGGGCLVCRCYGDHEGHEALKAFLEMRRSGKTRVSVRTFIMKFIGDEYGLKGCVTTWNTHIRECLGYGDVFRGGK